MVLYSVVTTYHLLEAIVHKLKYNKGCSGVLMLSRWLKAKYPWYTDMQSIFEKIIVFDAQYAYPDDITEKLDRYFVQLLGDSEVDLSQMEQIHVYGAEHAFGVFLFINKIENIYWEEGKGALSKKDAMLELFTKTNGPQKAEFQYKLHLYDGEASFVKKRYYNRTFQSKELDDENLCHFDLVQELQEMEEKERDAVIGLFYREDKIEAGRGDAVLLTEHFANLSIMSWDEQRLLYQYLTDYFLSRYRLLIKPHPDDVMYYEYVFTDSHVIRTCFPSELLPFIFEGQPEVVATSSSTGIYDFRTMYDKVLEFNFEFSHGKQFYNLNRYYVALSYADSYIKNGYELKLIGVNPAYIDNFQSFCKLCETPYQSICLEAKPPGEYGQGKSVWIVDRIADPHTNAFDICMLMEKLQTDDIIIFINTDGSYCFYTYPYKYLWKYLHVIEIDIRADRKPEESITFSGPSYTEDRKEQIYVFQKGEKMDRFHLEKELPNVGVTVSAQGYDGQAEKIKILEGMLEATEKRLLYYIKREKDLLSELGEKKA